MITKERLQYLKKYYSGFDVPLWVNDPKEIVEIIERLEKAEAEIARLQSWNDEDYPPKETM